MHSTAHRTTSVSNVCKNCLYHLGPHNRFHFLFPFTSSLKLFALSLMLVPLFETFTQLIFTTHKISSSVTPKLDHLAAKILESFKTRYEIIYVHGVDQLEMNHTCVGHVNRQHQRLTPSNLDVQEAKNVHSGEAKGKADKPSCYLLEGMLFVESLACHKIFWDNISAENRANSLPDLIWSAPRLAQRDKRRSAEGEAVGSNPGRTNTQDL